MQIDRLIQMMFIIVRKKYVTAKELADHFSVSKRTILRDIDKLSLAGIPILTARGNLGGIRILDEYTIDKSTVTTEEQERIINGLQVLQAMHIPDTEQVLEKIKALFRSVNKPSWIEVDFSFFGSIEHEKVKFSDIQKAILQKYIMNFAYFSSELRYSTRCVEPLKLLFRSHAWYIFAYCRYKQDYRLFRVSRMKSIHIAEEHFTRELVSDIEIEPNYGKSYELKLFRLKFSSEIAHRIYDEYQEQYVQVMDDGTFLVTCHYAVNEWVLSHILSFGSYVEVLEPVEVRQLIKERATQIASYY